MNIAKVQTFITQYKQNFNRVSIEELYKWKAVKCFQDNWDIESNDFVTMLEKSFSQTKNLLDSGLYFPRKMLIENAKIDSFEVRQLLSDLFEEEHGLIQRIDNFRSKFKILNSKNFPSRNDYQDHRAILVYLSLKFPERYFLYKYNMFKDFALKVEYNYLPIMGKNENIGHYQTMCDLIKYELINDQELLKLHKDRLGDDCYYDESFNILTQDFIYAVCSFDNNQKVPKNRFGVNRIIESDYLINNISGVSFNGRITNYLENEKENKRTGNLGEVWVIEREKEKLNGLGLSKLANLVRHISVEEGDGTGFDVESYDADGSRILIEVKTTKGDISQAFYVTRNELERSIVDKERYYLYRVYNFCEDNNTADLFLYKGSLEFICNCPTQYKVVLGK
jgi:hypothetical protein